jgi:type II secretory pathway pseudopilin PulG
MKTIRPPRVFSQNGLTLIETTVVLAVLLTLLSVLFMAAQSWKRGSDRAACIVTLRNIQVATRSYQNLYGYNAGGHPYTEYGTQDIARHLVEKGYIESKVYQIAIGEKNCSGGGTYQRPHADLFPLSGVLYANCSLATTANHAPTNPSDW